MYILFWPYHKLFHYLFSLLLSLLSDTKIFITSWYEEPNPSLQWIQVLLLSNIKTIGKIKITVRTLTNANDLWNENQFCKKEREREITCIPRVTIYMQSIFKAARFDIKGRKLCIFPNTVLIHHFNSEICVAIIC